jgi:hypothetical protein
VGREKTWKLWRNCLDVLGKAEVTVLVAAAYWASRPALPLFGRPDMSRKKRNIATDVNGTLAGSEEHADAAKADAAKMDADATAAAGAETTLRWQSLETSAPQRTKKPAAETASKEKKPTTRAPKSAKGDASQAEASQAKTPPADIPSEGIPQALPAQAGKLSALDAAAKVLQESGQPMNCQEMIQAMAAKGYWTSPAGKTPAATLYSAIAREIKIKGDQARFHKTARGQFLWQTPHAS